MFGQFIRNFGPSLNHRFFIDSSLYFSLKNMRAIRPQFLLNVFVPISKAVFVFSSDLIIEYINSCRIMNSVKPAFRLLSTLGLHMICYKFLYSLYLY